MVECKIIDGNDDWIKNYPDFKKDFLDETIRVFELRKKYDLSTAKYNYFREKVLNETGLKAKPIKNGGRRYNFTEDSFIVANKNGTYRIVKTIDYYKYTFGTYEDINTARLVRDKLIAADWDLNIGEKLNQKYGTDLSKKKYFLKNKKKME